MKLFKHGRKRVLFVFVFCLLETRWSRLARSSAMKSRRLSGSRSDGAGGSVAGGKGSLEGGKGSDADSVSSLAGDKAPTTEALEASSTGGTSSGTKTEAPHGGHQHEAPAEAPKTEAPNGGHQHEAPAEAPKTEAPHGGHQHEAPAEAPKTEGPYRGASFGRTVLGTSSDDSDDEPPARPWTCWGCGDVKSTQFNLPFCCANCGDTFCAACARVGEICMHCNRWMCCKDCYVEGPNGPQCEFHR